MKRAREPFPAEKGKKICLDQKRCIGESALVVAAVEYAVASKIEVTTIV
jgi:hypothetical protein